MLTPTQIEQISIELLAPFPEHPYRVEYNKDMEELIESIYRNGILSPLLLWEREQGVYVILSGHRRVFACEAINQTQLKLIATLPALVYRGITLEEATIIMVDENARREKLLPSEKARAYRMKLDAMKRQGKRTDLTSTQLVSKLGQDSATCAPMVHKLHGNKTRAIIAAEGGESHEQVRRYIRLTYLVPELLDMVDSNELGFQCGVALSYLSEAEQGLVMNAMKECKLTPTLKQAKLLKATAMDGELDEEKVISVLTEVRLDDRVTFRLRPGQLEQLNEASALAELGRSELLRAYASTGGVTYVGNEIVGELLDLKADIARIGNLLKMQQSRWDLLADNPWMLEKDSAAFSDALAQSQEIHADLEKSRKALTSLCERIREDLRRLNQGK